MPGYNTLRDPARPQGRPFSYPFQHHPLPTGMKKSAFLGEFYQAIH